MKNYIVKEHDITLELLRDSLVSIKDSVESMGLEPIYNYRKELQESILIRTWGVPLNYCEDITITSYIAKEVYYYLNYFYKGLRKRSNLVGMNENVSFLNKFQSNVKNWEESIIKELRSCYETLENNRLSDNEINFSLSSMLRVYIGYIFVSNMANFSEEYFKGAAFSNTDLSKLNLDIGRFSKKGVNIFDNIKSELS